MNVLEEQMEWLEVHREAINETRFAYRRLNPEKEQFLKTYKAFYDEIVATNSVNYPMDTENARKLAVARAVAVWADDFSE